MIGIDRRLLQNVDWPLIGTGLGFAVLSGLTLPPEYFREFYDSRYARHFYTDEEIRVFRSKWKTRESPAPAAKAVASPGS